MKKFCLLILLLLPFYLFAQPVEPYLSPLPKGSDISILVQTVSKNPKTLAQYKSDQFKQPASTQKVITALVAQLELGNDFQFTTNLKTTGKIVNKQLNGDLIVQLSGDPTFTRARLKSLIADLKQSGIEKIAGNIILNSAIFTSHDKASGWSWNNLTACYNAPASAAIIDGNCFGVIITPAKVGQKAHAAILQNTPISLTSDIRTISNSSKDLKDKYCELDISHIVKNQYHLSGCIPANKDKTYLKFAILDGVNYFTAHLQNELQKQQITYTGKILELNQPLPKQLTTLATSESAPLSDLLTVMLKKSNNLYADTIFRTVGAHHFNIAGTWRNSGDAAKQILREKAGIDLKNAVIIDGSGLSRLNLISADKMMEILQYIAANDTKLNMIAKLPTSGVDGTLQHRRSFNNPPLKEAVHAKTGYIQGSYNLAGFIQSKKGHYIAFVQLLTGYQAENERESPKSAIMQFESAFYKNFVNFTL
ncbi:serine-type D-Ala-D-Ala carboxypeptidase [Orbaceae bacterium ESL0721]|nr:serine-type D-Ala-D-Ala carboxypeptidase [Orbaceae bacterium ESL0721]